MAERPTCADCHKIAPDTQTEYTLISSRFRWRLTRRESPDGEESIDWHCPDCWQRLKAAAIPGRRA